MDGSPLLHWMSQIHWSCAALVLIFLLESAPLTGLFLPGIVFAASVGALTAHGYLPFWPTLVCVSLGGIIGDAVGFFLGWMGRDEWLRGPGGSSRRQHYEHALQLRERFGARLLVIGRFLWFLHPVVPLVAGASGISAKRFFLLDPAATILWSLVYLGIGRLGTGMWLEQRFHLLEGLSILLVMGVLITLWLRLRHQRTQ